MFDQAHFDIVTSGAKSFQEWRSANPNERLNLQEAPLEGLDLQECYLGDANLSKANLKEAKLGGSNLSGANLTGADLTGAGLKQTNFMNSDLRRAKMTACLAREANFFAADLSLANLIEGFFTQADFHYAILRDSDAARADFLLADLRSADLSRAHLIGTSFERANLTKAIMNSCEIKDTIVARARMGGTVIVNCVLTEFQGLEKVHHSARSFIGAECLFNSPQQVDSRFFEQVGFHETLVEFAESLQLSSKPLRLQPSCFISHSSDDDEFCGRLADFLKANGVKVFLDDHDMRGGLPMKRQIQEAIELNDRFLLVLSKSSIESRWVASEIKKAYEKQDKEKRQVLFPIRLVSFATVKNWELFDSDVGTDLASVVRECFIPDFSEWTDEATFQQKAKKLLGDLAFR